MMKSFKENVSQAAKMRNNLKDTLLKGLILSTNSEMDKNGDKLDLVQLNTTYYLLGYVHHTRKDQIYCECCFDFLTTEQNELPNDFYAAYITKLKSQGFLRFASLGMYYTFAKVEKILQDHFKTDKAYLRDSFEKVIKEVATNGLGIPKICCESHRESMFSFLVYEYIEIRYHIESKRYKNSVVQQLKEEQQKLRKLGKMVK